MGRDIGVSEAQWLDVPTFLRIYEIFLRMYLGFRCLLRGGNDPHSILKSSQSIKWTMRRGIGVLVAQGSDVQIFLRIYLGFQNLFQGGEQPPIPSQGSPKEYMDHENGDRGLGSARNGCT